jgi:hypothetical protein
MPLSEPDFSGTELDRFRTGFPARPKRHMQDGPQDAVISKSVQNQSQLAEVMIVECLLCLGRIF